MMDVGLLPGDKAVIDRSKLASIGDIVLAVARQLLWLVQRQLSCLVDAEIFTIVFA